MSGSSFTTNQEWFMLKPGFNIFLSGQVTLPLFS